MILFLDYAGLLAFHHLRDRVDVLRRGAATTTDDVEPAVVGEFFQLRRQRFRSFQILQLFVRNAGIRIMFGEVVEDLGPLNEQEINLGTQSTRLLHCRQDGEDFLVLETTDKVGLSVQTTWTKIDDKMLSKINSLVKPSNYES